MVSQALNHEITKKYIEEIFEKEVVPNLSEYISIDNLSRAFDPDWDKNGKLEKAANFLLNWALNFGVKGLKGELVKLDGFTPAIFIEIEGDPTKKSAFMYGHYDKQPHFTTWGEGLGPTTPVRRGDLLYGRGGADDGYAIFSSVISLKNIQNQGLTHGKVTILIEGEEESGSQGLIKYTEILRERIGKPSIVICLDSGALDYDRIWITNSLRGVVIIDLTVEVLEEAIHSGEGTGLAADSFMIIRNLLDRVEDSKTGNVIQELHVDIPEFMVNAAKQASDVLGEEYKKKIKTKEGVSLLHEDNVQLILNNLWRPYLAVVGSSGLPAHSTAGNVLRASTTVRLSFRLPPTADSAKCSEVLLEKLRKDPPFNSKVTVELKGNSTGWASKEFSSELKSSLDQISGYFFEDKKYVEIGCGGSIPFIKNLGDEFPECDFLVTGVLGPGSNAHSINECINIDFTKRVTSSVSHILANSIAK